MPEDLWPALKFGPVNLWRVQPAWRMSVARCFAREYSAPPVRLAEPRINSRATHLLRYRQGAFK